MWRRRCVLFACPSYFPFTLMQYSRRAKSVRIGCSSGFFGDTSLAARQLVQKGNLDYLVMDYLSEITMSLLVAAQKKNPDFGHIPDFVQQAKALIDAKNRGIKVVSNAGGMNPHGCAAALKQQLGDNSSSVKIAVVTGDNIISQLPDIKSQGIREMYTGAILPDSINSMTAYLGAVPIKRALSLGADIVITGRCTDSALVLGPLMHSMNWSETDLDKLASGSLAGHLIECGAQATGGIHTDWESVHGWHNIGFPVVEFNEDGSFTVSKPPGTGGLVSVPTVSEQMLYEIDDPQAYVLPDVVCDFSKVTIQATNKADEILVRGARGLPPTPYYKICSTYSAGYRMTAVCVVGGPKSVAKARKTADAILQRVNAEIKLRGMEPITQYNIQVLGSEQTYGAQANPLLEQASREAVLWFAVQHNDQRVLEFLSKEIAPAGTGMAPGLTAVVGGRPKVSPVFKLFSFLYPKSKIRMDISVDGMHAESYTADPSRLTFTSESPADNIAPDRSTQGPSTQRGSATYKVAELAYTRSGDKGNNCNIGVISRRPKLYPFLVEHLTSDRVGHYFRHVFESQKPDVVRYEAPGIYGLNFVLRNSLGGGGIASLRSDPQGKAFGQMLLDLELHGLPEGL